MFLKVSHDRVGLQKGAREESLNCLSGDSRTSDLASGYRCKIVGRLLRRSRRGHLKWWGRMRLLPNFLKREPCNKGEGFIVLQDLCSFKIAFLA